MLKKYPFNSFAEGNTGTKSCVIEKRQQIIETVWCGVLAFFNIWVREKNLTEKLEFDTPFNTVLLHQFD